MDEVSMISRGLYRMVGEKLGTEKVVDMRRRVMALHQILRTAFICKNHNTFEDKLLSGSRGGGFRFASPDLDAMYIYRNMRVIFTFPTELQNNDEQMYLMADRYATKPGLPELRVLNSPNDAQVTALTVSYGEGCYVASQKWRDHFTSLFPYLIPHGPCSTTMSGRTEYDVAICIKSDTLPEEAHSFIRRLRKAGWPSTWTLERIASGGCHFVAIGAKVSPKLFVMFHVVLYTTFRLDKQWVLSKLFHPRKQHVFWQSLWYSSCSSAFSSRAAL